MARKPAKPDVISCALRILALREHTSFELAQKLRKREYGEAEIEAALVQCRAWNYLDDARAAGVLVRTLLKKGAGFNKIKFELSKRRVPINIAENLLRELDTAGNQLEAALALVAKKFVKADTHPEIHKQKGKIYRYLQNKGYSSEIIYQVMQTFYCK